MYGHLIQQTKFNLFPQYKCTIFHLTQLHVSAHNLYKYFNNIFSLIFTDLHMYRKSGVWT